MRISDSGINWGGIMGYARVNHMVIIVIQEDMEGDLDMMNILIPKKRSNMVHLMPLFHLKIIGQEVCQRIFGLDINS